MTEKKKSPPRPDLEAKKPALSGRVTRDDQGNAVWQWKPDREEAQGNVNHLGLSIADSSPSPEPKMKVDKRGARAGYDPYQSNLIQKPKRPKATDLRALSRHIEQQRKLKKDEES